MKKFFRFRKILACSLTIAIMSSYVFTGCSKEDSNNNTQTEESKESNQKENSTKKDAKQVQAEFDEYMDELFIEEMSISSVSTHFSLENPEAYGITFEEASWGEPITIESIESDYKEQKEILDKLETFDKSLLTEEQQLTYETLYNYLENSYSFKDNYLLDEIFSPINGAHAEIPIIFSEYDFFTKDDIDDYLTLIETIDDYINNLLEYEKIRAEKGYFLTDDSADQVIEQCKDFIAPEENCLVSIFSEKLDNFGVTAEEKTAYMDRLNSAINDSLIPGYENIIATLEDLKGSRSTELGLSEFEGGAEYYENLIRSLTGSDKSVEELIDCVDQSLADNLSLVYRLLMENPELYDEYMDYAYPDEDPESTILMQIEQAKKYFPEIGDIPFEVKSVPVSLESTMSPAFYLIPPIDNKDKNMIYINHSEEYEQMNLFTTIAHEGVPGHMYQCYYFANTNPDPIRNVLSFGGYNEGWATYVEQYAYEFAGMSTPLAKLAYANDQYSFGLYSRVDLGIHYEGWDVDDVNNFLGKHGMNDIELAKELYDTMIDEPAVYLQYFIGCLEIIELRDKAEEELDSFDEIEFHKFFLEIGPTYFDIIEDELDQWIEKENSI